MTEPLCRLCLEAGRVTPAIGDVALVGARPGRIEASDGVTVFAHARRRCLEGILSKRRGGPYQHGRSRTWLKTKNPASPAATRVMDGSF